MDREKVLTYLAGICTDAKAILTVTEFTEMQETGVHSALHIISVMAERIRDAAASTAKEIEFPEE